MSIFLCLGNAKLVFSGACESLSEGVRNEFLIEEDMESSEGSVVWSKTAVVKRNGVHSLLRHIVLRKDGCHLTSAVITEVEEYNGVVSFYLSKRLAAFGNYYRLDELIGNAFIIRCLDGGLSAFELGALSGYEHIVGCLDTVPSLVSVHRIEASADRSYLAGAFCHLLFELFHEAKSAVRVGVASVHKAVYEHIFEAVALSFCEEFVDVIE